MKCGFGGSGEFSSRSRYLLPAYSVWDLALCLNILLTTENAFIFAFRFRLT